MSIKHERRRCRSCKRLFTPDPRCRFHQRFCRRDECRKSSKAESQDKYRTKIENLWQFQGEKIFAKLASQQPVGAKLAVPWDGDEKTRQEALNWGLMAVVCGSLSQVVIERTYKRVLATGREMLRKKAETAARGEARAGDMARQQ